jgi:hypothetical protein
MLSKMFNDSMSNPFWVTCDTSWKLQTFFKSRAITLKILNESRRKYPGAQLHMLINIPVKFHDSMSNPFWVTCDTSWKLQNFTKSKTITLKILNKSTRKYPGAHLHVLINIPVKFHDSRSNTFFSYKRHKLKIAKFYYVKGNNSKNTKNINTKIPRCTTTHTDQYSCKVSWL